MKEGKYAEIVAKVKPVQFFVRERFGEMIFPNFIERRWCPLKPLSMSFATKA